MLTHLAQGANLLLNTQGIVYLIVGSVVGVVLGVVPGIGGLVLLTMILAFINHISLVGAICLFLATQAASYFSASVSSILLNTPAHPEAFAVTFDGFPMARNGEPGKALGISAASTCAGGLIGCFIFVAFIPLVNQLPLIFKPPELALLVLIAMLLIATLGADSVSKALISIGIGIMIASIGPSPITGDFRYAFNATGLANGVSLVALALGSFAIPQMVLVFGTATTVARQDMMGRAVSQTEAVQLHSGFGHQVIEGIGETFRHWVLLIESGIIGALTGIIPGIGGFAANFLSYGIAQQTSRRSRRELFGTGIAEGIIAPEGSSLSKEAGGLIPIIGLGIPGGVGGALFIAALSIKGVMVGFGFSTKYPVLPYEMIWVVALGGVIGTTIGVLSASSLARVTRVPGPALVPFMMTLAVVGAFVSDVSFFSVMEMFVLSIVGFTLRRLRYSLASFAIGLVLAPYLEQDVDLTADVFPHFTWLRRPLSDAFVVLAILILTMKALQMRRHAALEKVRIQGKAVENVESTQPSSMTDRASRVITWRLDAERHPYPLLGIITTASIVAISVAFVVYGIANYDFRTGLMPEIASAATAAAGLWRLFPDGRAYQRHRAYRAFANNATRADVKTEPDESAKIYADADLISSSTGVSESNTATVATAAGTVKVSNNLTSSLQSKERFPAIQDNAWGFRGQYGRELLAFFWLAGLVGTCYFFGFLIAVPLFCVAYGLTSTGRFLESAWARLIFAALSAAAMWGMTDGMITVLHLSFQPVINL